MASAIDPGGGGKPPAPTLSSPLATATTTTTATTTATTGSRDGDAVRRELLRDVKTQVRAVLNGEVAAFNTEGGYDGAGFGRLVSTLEAIMAHGVRATPTTGVAGAAAAAAEAVSRADTAASALMATPPRTGAMSHRGSDEAGRRATVSGAVRVAPKPTCAACWGFISSLSELGHYLARVVSAAQAQAESLDQRVRIWLAQALFEKRLSSFLGILTSSDEELSKFYHEGAMLRSPRDVQALRMWVTAFENSDMAGVPSSQPTTPTAAAAAPTSAAAVAGVSPLLMRRLSISSNASSGSRGSVESLVALATAPPGFHRQRPRSSPKPAADGKAEKKTETAQATSPAQPPASSPAPTPPPPTAASSAPAPAPAATTTADTTQKRRRRLSDEFRSVDTSSTTTPSQSNRQSPVQPPTPTRAHPGAGGSEQAQRLPTIVTNSPPHPIRPTPTPAAGGVAKGTATPPRSTETRDSGARDFAAFDAPGDDAMSTSPTGLSSDMQSNGSAGGRLVRSNTVSSASVSSTGHSVVHIPYISSGDSATSEALEKENRHFVVIEALIAAMEEAHSNQEASARMQRGTLPSEGGDGSATPERGGPVLPLPRAWDSPTPSSRDEDDLMRTRNRLQANLRSMSRAQPSRRSTLGERDRAAASAAATKSTPGDDGGSPTLAVRLRVDDVPVTVTPHRDTLRVKQRRGHTRDSSISSLTSVTSSGSEMSDWIAVDMTPSQRVPNPGPGVVQQQGGGSCFRRDRSSSAEDVAIGFLKSLSSDFPSLQLLVPDGDVPQDLLPLPIVSFQDMQAGGEGWHDVRTNDSNRTRLRGNEEWAPPRRQLIFTVHKKLPRKTAIALQNHRCTGCGLRVELNYVKRFRYCEYLGKYFCPSCHSKSLAVIPARVLTKWDFRKYPVSNFAAEFLASIAQEPMFELEALQPGIHAKVRHLSTIGRIRAQLADVRNYLLTCRSGTGLLEALDTPPHLVMALGVYSLTDLLAVNNGTMLARLQQLAKLCFDHITDCPLCQAKGFVCELCNNASDILFPFEFDRVAKCHDCGDVFHRKCFEEKSIGASGCPKCSRRRAYRAQQAAKAASPG